MVTNEDKQLICDYMGWKMWKVNFDLNDAGLCVEEMQKRGNYFVFEMYAMGLFKSIGYRKVTAKFIPWLFNADNFFGALAAWLKEGKK